ncbi:MAG: hypothetical protein ACFFBH_16950 [Promethearchaeota archaeon]
MNLIDVRTKIPFIIDSSLLISEDLLPSYEIKGEYWETLAITPVIIIENIKIHNKEDIFKIITKKEIYGQLFVLARIYLYLDDSKNHVCFYFDGFPWSYLLKNVNKEIINKIDKIYDETQVDDCIENTYQQIIDQFSRMIEILLNNSYSLTLTARWAANEELNPQNKVK